MQTFEVPHTKRGIIIFANGLNEFMSPVTKHFAALTISLSRSVITTLTKA